MAEKVTELMSIRKVQSASLVLGCRTPHVRTERTIQSISIF
jgi:hypothetical protein